ncbi:hypothetical protein LVO79_14040 [Roseivivax marinus]|uniref:calcium-binding protein n=1 Tax=Roseivivax marinus TaxID=1379903 RepID=UPI001F046DE2|nr:calcium-binding protein [Roseivivax marinus]UMA64133.1 hypothetical protein LVO79_14040 [Roseivivax marinus]
MQRFFFTAPALTYDPAQGRLVTDVTMAEINLGLAIDNGTFVPKERLEVQGPPSAFEAALAEVHPRGGLSIDGEAVYGNYGFFFGLLEFEDAPAAEVLTISPAGTTVEYVVQISGPALDLSTPERANDVLDSITSVVAIPSGDASTLLRALMDADDSEGSASPGADAAGTDGNDILEGTADDDTLSGLDGDDRLDGRAGNDALFGGAGADGLLGRGGDDLLRAGAGDDTVAASNGNDSAYGGRGRDMIGGGTGDDLLEGGADDDTLGGGVGDDDLHGSLGDDVLAGGAGRDRLFGEDGGDTIGGSFGDDLVYGGAGGDSLGGGAGLDIIEGGAGDDSIGGGLGTDSVFGGAGSDFLAGGSGDDALVGGAGNDTLNAGVGSDSLHGGEGADVFVWNAADPGARDVIYDFTPLEDRIRLTGVDSIDELNVDYTASVSLIYEGQDLETAVVDYNGQEIVLQGVQAGELDESHFIFV